MSRSASSPVLFSALLAAAYSASVLVGRSTRLDGSDTALVWPAAAVAVIWMVLAARRDLVLVSGVVLAALTVWLNHLTGASWALSAGFGVVNLVCATSIAAAMTWRGREPRLADPGDLYRLLAAVNLGNVVSAALGAQMLSWRGVPWGEAFLSFGTRNGVSVFVGLAAYLTLLEVRRDRGSLRPPPVPLLHRLEVLALLAVSAAVLVLVFWVNEGSAVAFLTIPVVVVVGLRLSTAAGVAHTVALGAAVIAATLAGRGAFIDGPPGSRALLAQLLVGCVMLVSLTIALFRDSLARLVEDLHAANQRSLAAAEQLRHVALYDPLTGLPNRVLLTERLERALAVSHRTALTVGVLFLDLDGFKQVNDERGHAAGDEVLTEVAVRLRATARPGDTVARLGGDEFVVVCPDLRGAAELTLIARRHAQSVTAPLVLTDGTAVRGLSTSVGSAVSTLGSTAGSLLSAADHAMYDAKRAARAGPAPGPGSPGSRAAHG